MVEEVETFSPEEITPLLAASFAAPLIISSVGWMVYGATICHFVRYMQLFSKRDHLLTRAWVITVMIFASSSSLYQARWDWMSGIAGFTTESTNAASYINGVQVVLYSIVVMLVQFFWLGCLSRAMAPISNLAKLMIASIGFVSFAAFVMAVGVAVYPYFDTEPYFGWPTPTISVLVRSMLGLDLAADLAILTALITRLIIMSRSSVHTKRTISKLGYYLCGTTFTSTLLIVGELVASLPQSDDVRIKYSISFAALMGPVYALGLLTVLNARSDLWSDKRRSQARTPNDTGSRGLIPGLRFTVDLPDRRTTTQSRHPSSSEPAMTFISTRRRSGEREAME